MQENKHTVVEFPRALSILVAGAAAIIVISGMREAAPILSTFLMALVITIGLAPLPGRMARKGVPIWLAFLITVFAAVLFIFALVVFLGGALIQFANAIPGYQSSLVALRASLVDTATALGIDLTEFNIVQFIDPSGLGALLASFVSSILGVLSDTSLLLLLVFFMLLDAIGFGDKLDEVFSQRREARGGLQRFVTDTRKYIVITTWTGLLVGAVNALVLWMLGVDFPVLWGLLAFLFSFIPNIGFLLSMIPPTLLALLEFGPGKALIVIAAYIIINAGVDNVLKPKVIGDDLDLSLATTFISLVFWGWVLGPLGGILAIPLTLLVKHLFLEPGEDSRWLSKLMSQKLPASDDAPAPPPTDSPAEEPAPQPAS